VNIYSFCFLTEPTTPPVIGDASTLGTLVGAIGNLLFSGAEMRMVARPTITTGAYVATNATAGNPAVEIQMVSKYRLDSALMPASMGATTSGTLYTAGGAIWGAAVALDDKCSEILEALDAPIVTRGCGIVAYVPAGTTLSSQLTDQIVVPVCNGQQLIIGRAKQTAQDGTYATPFSTAWAYGIFGARTIETVTNMPVPERTSFQRLTAGRA